MASIRVDPGPREGFRRNQMRWPRSNGLRCTGNEPVDWHGRSIGSRFENATYAIGLLPLRDRDLTVDPAEQLFAKFGNQGKQ
jgi:hypothetical protein